MSIRYEVSCGDGLWHVRDTWHGEVIASWRSRTAAEADARMRNSREAALA